MKRLVLTTVLATLWFASPAAAAPADALDGYKPNPVLDGARAERREGSERRRERRRGDRRRHRRGFGFYATSMSCLDPFQPPVVLLACTLLLRGGGDRDSPFDVLK